MHCMHTVPAEDTVRDPETIVTVGCEPLFGNWELFPAANALTSGAIFSSAEVLTF